MKTKVDLALVQEAEAFAFRFACEDCVHFAGHTPRATCTLEYPAEPQRGALEGDFVVFCKEFDLGVGEV